MIKIIKKQDGYAPLSGGIFFQALRDRLQKEWSLVVDGSGFYELRERRPKGKKAQAKKPTVTKVLVFRLSAGDNRFSKIIFEIFDTKYEHLVETLKL